MVFPRSYQPQLSASLPSSYTNAFSSVVSASPGITNKVGIAQNSTSSLIDVQNTAMWLAQGN